MSEPLIELLLEKYPNSFDAFRDPLMNWIEKYLRIDDRGRARVLWHYNSKYKATTLAFRFDFQIEFDDFHLKEEDIFNLRRRGDIFFPPITMGIWVINGTVANTEIEERFNGLDTSSWTNIRGYKWADVLEEIPNWEQNCVESGSGCEKILENSRVRDALKHAIDLAKMPREEGILSVRASRATSKPEQEATRIELEKELKLLAAIEKGIINPSVRMIAAGAHIMSPREIPEKILNLSCRYGTQ